MHRKGKEVQSGKFQLAPLTLLTCILILNFNLWSSEKIISVVSAAQSVGL